MALQHVRAFAILANVSSTAGMTRADATATGGADDAAAGTRGPGAGASLSRRDGVAGLRAVRDALGSLVERLEPGAFDAVAATEAVGLFAELKKLAGAGEALMARRVDDTGAWAASGARSAAHWLATQAGTSVGEASGVLDTAKKLDVLPQTAEAYRKGRLSGSQTRRIADTACEDPSGEGELLAAAGRGAKALGEEIHRQRARREGERERYARVHRGRFFRHRVDDDGAFTGQFRLTADVGAEVLAALKPFQERAFRQARTEGRREPAHAYAADGLRDLARYVRASFHKDGAAGETARETVGATDDTTAVGGVGPPLRPGRDVKIIVRVDGDALLRGEAADGEICEIAGLGPVPVPVVYSMLPEAFATAVITRGEAVATVAHAGRQVTATQRTALEWAGVVCEVEGCEVREHLEIDHLIDYAITRRTAVAELGFKCGYHHDLKTYQGWQYAPGTKRLVPPDHPDHPGQPDRAKATVEAAKRARARARRRTSARRRQHASTSESDRAVAGTADRAPPGARQRHTRVARPVAGELPLGA
jgi:hypothetical protein